MTEEQKDRLAKDVGPIVTGIMDELRRQRLTPEQAICGVLFTAVNLIQSEDDLPTHEVMKDIGRSVAGTLMDLGAVPMKACLGALATRIPLSSVVGRTLQEAEGAANAG